MKTANYLILIIFLMAQFVLMTSCSYFRTSRETVNDGTPASQPANGNLGRTSKMQTVPKPQYDELLRRYEVLARKVEDLEDHKKLGANGLMQEAALQRPEVTHEVLPGSVPAIPAGSPSKSLRSEGKSLQQSIDTVDVFAEVDKKTTPMISYDSQDEADNTERLEADLENEIFALRGAIADLSAGRLDKSMKTLKALEMSKHPQIVVRSKYQIGLLLMKQQIFDLALQTFEEIIQSQAFSSVVLNALKQSVTCSEKLNLQDKKRQYQSLLKDAFGVV